MPQSCRIEAKWSDMSSGDHLSPRRLGAAIAAASLVIAGCAGGNDPVEIESGAAPSTNAPAQAESSAPEPTDAPATTAAVQETTTVAPAEEESVETTAALPAEENLFPDTTAFDVSTGELVNMKELASSGTPVAMWFWFPH